MQDLGMVMKETILQKLKRTSSIDSHLVCFLICCFRTVRTLGLKARRYGRLHCSIFSFKITNRSCDRSCSAVICMVTDTAVSQRWDTTFCWGEKMYIRIFSLSHMIETFKGRTNCFSLESKSESFEKSNDYVPLVAVQLVSILKVPPLCLIAHL